MAANHQTATKKRAHLQHSHVQLQAEHHRRQAHHHRESLMQLPADQINIMREIRQPREGNSGCGGVHTSGCTGIGQKHAGLRPGEAEIGDSPGRRKREERRRKRKPTALMREGWWVWWGHQVAWCLDPGGSMPERSGQPKTIQRMTLKLNGSLRPPQPGPRDLERTPEICSLETNFSRALAI
jgi:hypothetical protein